ncbi:MAG: YfhO family protein [Planctomycetia bacterium]|nr:YfhO family protein [Planctomycetia bacterium]
MYRWLPFDQAYGIEVVLPMVLVLAGMVVFLRKHIGRGGAWMGGLLAAFSLQFVQHTQQPQLTTILAHIPWLLWAIDVGAYATSLQLKCRSCVGIALLTGSMILLGHPQSLWMSMITAAFYAAYVLTQQRAGWRSWALVIGGMLLGLCVGAVQLFATYSVFASSTRAAGDRYILPHPVIESEAFLDVVAPYRTRMVFLTTYLGAAPLLLTLWWLTAAYHRSAAPATSSSNEAETRSPPASSRSLLHLSIWAFAFVVLSAVLSMGLNGKLYYLQFWLPVAGTLRAPCRYLTLTQFGMAIISAVAFSRLMVTTRDKIKTPWRHLTLPWLAFVGSVVMALIIAKEMNYKQADRHIQAQFYMGPVMIGIAALGLTLAARGIRAGLYILVIWTALDLGFFSVADIRTDVCWRKLPTFDQFVARLALPPDHKGRFADWGTPGVWILPQVDTTSLLLNYRAITGYAGLYPNKRLIYSDLNSLRVADVSWFWQPANMDSLVAGVKTPKNEGWCPVPNPLPRVRLVSKTQTSDTPETDINRIDVDTTALVTHAIDVPPSTPGTATLADDQPQRISVNVDAPDRQLLVLSESFDGAWQTRIDGQPTTTERVNGDFMGCVVPAGKHRVDFEFQSGGIYYGRIVSLLALGGCLIAACATLFGGRKRQAST